MRLPARSGVAALWLRVVLAQAGALTIAAAVAPAEPWAFAGAHGAAAAGLAGALRLPWWWLCMNGLAAPAACGLALLALSPAWYLAAGAALALFYGGTFTTRVPLYPSRPGAVAALARLALPGSIVSDLGCGTGTVLAALARLRPDLKLSGVEAAPLPWAVSALRGRLAGGAFRARWGDFWKHDLAACDLVYAFLSPAPMPELWKKARLEMRPGSLLVSNSFPVPGVRPWKIIGNGGPAGTLLYVWRM